ncbi:MAG: hypothetical protein JWM44_242 [Bacilli bacterium]|jgi:tRNA threonylcarbamoyladenosine biosynthesis protein TsaB|nr:hypothetical protein [Bacilli bacterium]
MIQSEQNQKLHFPGRLLAIDTSTAAMSIAVLENGRLLRESHIHAERNHSVFLMPMMEELLLSLNMRFADLSAFAVGVGPGSYTGVRIGVTAVKTLAWALKLPVIAISSLEAMALGAAMAAKSEESWFVPLMNARRTQVYTGLFAANDPKIDWQRLSADGIHLLEQWLDQLAKLAPKRISFVGEVADFYEQLNSIGHRFSGEITLREHTIQAIHIGLLGSLRLAVGERSDTHQLVPNYTQLTEAEANLLAKPH